MSSKISSMYKAAVCISLVSRKWCGAEHKLILGFQKCQKLGVEKCHFWEFSKWWNFPLDGFSWPPGLRNYSIFSRSRAAVGGPLGEPGAYFWSKNCPKTYDKSQNCEKINSQKYSFFWASFLDLGPCFSWPQAIAKLQDNDQMKDYAQLH